MIPCWINKIKEAAIVKKLAIILASFFVVVSGALAKTKRVHSVAKAAQYEATHGGILSHTPEISWGKATPHMKELTRALVYLKFKKAGAYVTRKALCIVHREAGDNPGAVSATEDYGPAQVNKPSHPKYDYYRMINDPVYGVNVFWQVSDHGKNFHPWDGGKYPCPRH